jgi:hypothetical protein
VEAPDLATVKDFLRFKAAAGKGMIAEQTTCDSLNTFAEWFFAGFTRVTDTEINKEDRSEVYDVSIFYHLMARPDLILTSGSEKSCLRKASESGASTPSDQKPREEKSAPYRHPGYEALLATKNSFMKKSAEGITNTSKDLCRAMLDSEQDPPPHSLFRDDVFDKTCQKLQNRNEALIIQDIGRLIVPSAQNLAIFGTPMLADNTPPCG